MVKKKRIAIIPARGKSKRIPKKNILEVAGKPMIAYTIEAALKSQLFDRVMVSTDDEEIARISEEHGAWVPFKRSEYVDDYSTVSDVTINALRVLETEFGEIYDVVVQLMANCPLRDHTEITKATEFFEDNDHNFQISCFQYGWMNPWWAHKLDEDMKATPLFSDEMKGKRSQDLDNLYCPTGAIWISTVADLLKDKSFYGENYRFFPMSWRKALDIDDYEDLRMVEVLLPTKNQ